MKFAHTDKDSGREASILLGDPAVPADASSVGWKWEWTPLPRSWLAPIRSLCETQSDRFVAELLAIEQQLAAATAT